MNKREICERLVKMSSELLYVSLQWNLSTGYGRDHAKRAMELLEIAQELDPDLAAPKEKGPHVRTCNDKFAYTNCDCGAKAYVKMRGSEGEELVAKCVKCGKILRGLVSWSIGWTDDPPPENLFVKEEEKDA